MKKATYSEQVICPECGESMELVKKGTISAGYRCSKHGYFVQLGSSLLSLTPKFIDVRFASFGGETFVSGDGV